MKTYGTATKQPQESTWRITAEPHVMLRLKRIFGKLSRASHGSILLSDTSENCRDLEWFCERYPLEISPADHLRDRAAQHRDRAAEVAAILAGTINPRAFEMAIPPREYQRLAADLALRTGGLLLADDVGIGKTCSAICMLTDPATRPALVVTLTHLPRQWEAEIHRFAPTLRTHILTSGRPYDLTKATKRTSAQLPLLAPEFPDVIITNYHKLSGWADTLAPLIKSVVFDECQELRHRKSGMNVSAKYAAASHLSEASTFRLGLSATPIYNYGGEFYNVLQCLRPHALGTEAEFKTEWCTYEQKPRIRDPKAFGTYVREQGLMLRRTRLEVGRELPSLTKIPHCVNADTLALEAIGDRTAELARLILTNNPTAKGEKWKAAEEMSYLVRQATGIAKAPYVADFVRLLVESGERVLLGGWHHEVYAVWEDRLRDLSPARFTGLESPNEKERAKQRFLKGETPVLMMSLRAGAGIDGLQGACSVVVFGELDWSPAVHEQFTGRIHRDGQAAPVLAYYLIAESGSDPVISDVLGVKRAQIDGVRDPYADLVERLDTGSGQDQVRRLATMVLRSQGLTLTTDSDDAISPASSPSAAPCPEPPSVHSRVAPLQAQP